LLLARPGVQDGYDDDTDPNADRHGPIEDLNNPLK
jgi:hypothetical protein